MNKDIINLPHKNFFSAQELVELGFYKSVKSVYWAVHHKKSPAHVKTGRALMFPRSYLLEWLEQNIRR